VHAAEVELGHELRDERAGVARIALEHALEHGVEEAERERPAPRTLVQWKERLLVDGFQTLAQDLDRLGRRHLADFDSGRIRRKEIGSACRDQADRVRTTGEKRRYVLDSPRIVENQEDAPLAERLRERGAR